MTPQLTCASILYLCLILSTISGCYSFGDPSSLTAELGPVSVDQQPLAETSGVCTGTFKEHPLDHTTTIAGDVVRLFNSNGSGLAINDLDNDSDELQQRYEAFDSSSIVPDIAVVEIAYNDDGFVSSPNEVFTFAVQLDDCLVEGREITVNPNGRVEVATLDCP